MKTCETCEWWDKLAGHKGWCWLITKRETEKAMTYNCCNTCESMRFGTFQTTPDFGCNLHQEKEGE